jgi:hypothetical protein
MKTVTSNRANMINSTLTYCGANTSATAGIPQFAIIVGQVGTKMVLVNSLNQISTGTTTGITLDTNALRTAMTSFALKCSKGTLAFANQTNNNALAALVKYTKTDLERATKEDVDDLCENIYDGTSANIALLAGFGILPADVTDLRTSIDLFRIASQNSRQAIITKKQANKQIEAIVRMVIDDLLIDQLDNLAGTLEMSNPEFVSGYKYAREIIDLGRTTAKIRGTVLNINDVPLQQVEFSVFKAGTNELVKRVSTDIKGKYGAAELPAIFVDLQWRLAGYETLTETNLKIVAGKEYQRKKVMIEVS